MRKSHFLLELIIVASDFFKAAQNGHNKFKSIFPFHSLLNPLNKKIKILLTIISIIYCFNQKGLSQLPKIIPPSPEASALFRTLDFPINNSKGVPNINLPLYEIKSGGLVVPISISYNPEGRKVFDQTGPIGMGWSLNAGGMISRTIYGKPDDRNPFPMNLKPAYTLSNWGDYDFIESIHHQEPGLSSYDSEYDIFSYYFGQYSGKFIFDTRSSKIHLLPSKPIQIQERSFPEHIIDDKGIIYSFKENEYSREAGNPITSKLLTSITSPDKKTIITFTYTTFELGDAILSEDYVIVDNDTRLNPSGGYRHFSNRFQNNNNSRLYHVKRITEINFPEGKIKFLLDSPKDRIKSMQVYNFRGDLIKTIDLVRSYLDAPIFSGYLETFKLDALLFKDKNNNIIEKFSFEYEPTLQHFDTKNRDYWGYLNNYSSYNVHTVPEYYDITAFSGPSGVEFSSLIDIRGGNRRPNDACKASVLKKITYPTGGSTEFSYESNRYTYFGRETIAGGLRVSQIKSTDNNGSVLYKTYKYGLNESGSGIVNFYNIQPEDMSYEIRSMSGLGQDYTYFNKNESYRTRIYSSEFLPEIAEIAHDPIFYPEITEYAGTLTNNIGKTVYKYSDKNHSTLSVFPTPVFPGLTYHAFGYPIDQTLRRRYVSVYNLWQNSNLLLTDFYTNTGNTLNLYKKVKTVYNNYTATQTDVLKGLHIYRYLEFGGYRPGERAAATTYRLPVFLFADYEISVGKEELTGTYEVLYTDNGDIVNGSAFIYNENLLVSEVHKMTSNNKLLITKYKYSTDFIGDTQFGSLYKKMVSQNMLNYVIEESHFAGPTFLNSTKTNYDHWGLSGFYPRTVDIKQGANGYETRSRFYTYTERGNILSMSKENDVKQSFVWGYNDAYPIAQVINAESNNAFHTSFENGDGNSLDNDSKTGKRSKTNGFSASLTGLSNGDYFITYWQKSANTWHFQSNKITVTNGSYNVSLNGQVDEVRFYPTTAHMTTYTYDPLIGVTSECDANNNAIYYEYDDFGRLRLIRNKDHNILKKICYNYAGQPEFCTSYGNIDLSRDYYSQTCSYGFLAAPIYVSIPAGMFTSFLSQADANDKAQQYAQKYANQYGTCKSLSQVDLYYSNFAFAYGYTVELYHTSTKQTYTFVIGNYGNGYLGSIPEGTYNITYLSDADYRNFRFSAGCSYYNSGYGSVKLYGIPLSEACNTLKISN